MNASAVHRLNSRNVAGPGGSVPAGRDGWRQLMRHVVLQFWLSLDGYSCDEDTELYRLMEEIEDPEQEECFVGRLRQAGTHIMGRVTYEEMAKFRPTTDHPIAAPMNEIPKVVFSASLAICDLAPDPDRPRGHRGGTGAAEAGTCREIIAHGGARRIRPASCVTCQPTTRSHSALRG